MRVPGFKDFINLINMYRNNKLLFMDLTVSTDVSKVNNCCRFSAAKVQHELNNTESDSS